MHHPALARLPCADCQLYVIDYDWSKHEGTAKPKNTFGPCKPEDAHKRPPQAKPPCHKCPKRSPAEESQHVLSRKNWKTFQLALQVHATGGRCLTDEMAADGLLMQNVTDVCRIIDSYQRHDLAERIAIHTYGINRK